MQSPAIMFVVQQAKDKEAEITGGATPRTNAVPKIAGGKANDGGKATQRALSIQTELQALAPSGDPVCFPKELAKALAQ